MLTRALFSKYVLKCRRKTKWLEYNIVLNLWFWYLEKTFCFYELYAADNLSLSVSLFKIQLLFIGSGIYIFNLECVYIQRLKTFAFFGYLHRLDSSKNKWTWTSNNGNTLVDWVQLGFCFHNSSCSCAFNWRNACKGKILSLDWYPTATWLS